MKLAAPARGEAVSVGRARRRWRITIPAMVTVGALVASPAALATRSSLSLSGPTTVSINASGYSLTLTGYDARPLNDLEVFLISDVTPGPNACPATVAGSRALATATGPGHLLLHTKLRVNHAVLEHVGWAPAAQPQTDATCAYLYDSHAPKKPGPTAGHLVTTVNS